VETALQVYSKESLTTSKPLAGLTLTSTWCLLGTFRAFGLLKSKEESQSFNLRGLIAVGRSPTAKRLEGRGFVYDIYANPTASVTLPVLT